MSTNIHFCVCRDHKCPFHPTNHNEGCDPCIKKNLKYGEIPSCFFRAVSNDLETVEAFTYVGFAEHVNKYNLNK